MSELLVSRGTFRSFEVDEIPTVLASGLLGVYYNNTEKLFRDTSFINEHGENPYMMGEAARSQVEGDPDLCKFFAIIADRLWNIHKNDLDNLFIAGGLKRDVPFSYVIARMLEIPHVGIYKPSNNSVSGIQFVNKSGEITEKSSLRNHRGIIVPDLITEGSSIAENLPGDIKLGWIRSIEELKGKVLAVYPVVDRCEGGVKNVERLTGVQSFPFIQIDEGFLSENSPEETKERDLEYVRNPQEFGERRIIEGNGVESLVKQGKKYRSNGKDDDLLKLRKAVTRFSGALKANDNAKEDELKRRLTEEVDLSLDDLFFREAA